MRKAPRLAEGDFLLRYFQGWGRNDFSTTGAFQAVMREVDVPLVDQTACQNLLRATRLGANFALDSTSFMCAGGENGKGRKRGGLFTFTLC